MAPLYSNSYTSISSHRSFVNQPQPLPNVFYVGVDVGTGSARAAVIDSTGVILGLSERPITRHELKPSHITQSSSEIWSSICYCVKTAIRDSGIDPQDVYGIGFDATCSLVVIDEQTDKPVAVGPDFTNDLENIILWMDHRAQAETDAINATGDKCLKYVGGTMSIEMEMPKIKWLKHHLPAEVFKNCKFYDLADYLTHKATDSEARSFCSAVCKQGFVPPGVDGSETGWSKEFLLKIDLPELVENDFQKLGGIPNKNGSYLSAGDPVGNLTEKAAEELGLTVDCIVGSGVIDAYAGWIGTVAGKADIPALIKQDQHESGISRSCGRLAAVAGTSTCHIAMTKEPYFVNGVWGPYKDVMAQGYWLAEGGQSCTGALLAHVLATHPAYSELATLAEASNLSKFDYLNSTLENLVRERSARSVVSLAKHLFFYGDFHGNRSPIADPRMKAAIIGQSMDTSVNDLAITYFGACEFIAQQTRQIIEEMEKSGHDITCIFLSGGQCRNGLLMRLLADCTGLPIVIPRYIDAAVVFGAALLGAVASEAVSKKSKKTRSRRSSSVSKADIHEQPSSPYTAPSATASYTSISAMAPPGSSFPFPVMTPMNEEAEENQDYFANHKLKGSAINVDSSEESSDDEGQATLTFGAKQKTQQSLSSKLKRELNLKPLTSMTDSKEKPGDKLWSVMEKLTGPGRVVMPSDTDHPDRRLLAAKYKIFLDLCQRQRDYRKQIDVVEDENIRNSTTSSSANTVKA